jgi:2-oxoglutarate ferredoxin oxidoreductase subunit beta
MGFSVVEILSPCPTAYGRRNKQANPVDMMNWLKDNVIQKDKLEKMSEDEKLGKIASGVLWDVEKPEFTAEYDKLIEKLRAEKQPKE